MRLSFNTWCVGSFPAWLPSYPLEVVAARLAALGYEGVELGAAAPHAFPDYVDAARRAAIRDLVTANRMEFSAMCPAIGGGAGYNPVSPDRPERDAFTRYYHGCVQLAADIGCPRLIFLGGYRRYGQSAADAWSRAVAALQEAAADAAAHGVRLIVEATPADSNVIDSVGDAQRLIDEAGVDAGMMFDTYHSLHRADEHEDVIEQAGDRLEYVHLSDRERDAPGSHEDFIGIVEALRRRGYDGWLSMEIGFNRRSSDPFALARAAHAHVVDCLRRAG
jgi:protein FrlC